MSIEKVRLLTKLARQPHVFTTNHLVNESPYPPKETRQVIRASAQVRDAMLKNREGRHTYLFNMAMKAFTGQSSKSA